MGLAEKIRAESGTSAETAAAQFKKQILAGNPSPAFALLMMLIKRAGRIEFDIDELLDMGHFTFTKVAVKGRRVIIDSDSTFPDPPT